MVRENCCATVKAEDVRNPRCSASGLVSTIICKAICHCIIACINTHSTILIGRLSVGL